MSSMLAFANETDALPKIEGRPTIIKSMADAVLDCAKLIDEYTKMGFTS
jgi:hypothetical protein